MFYEGGVYIGSLRSVVKRRGFLCTFCKNGEKCYTNLRFIKSGIQRLWIKLVDGT